VNIFTLATGQDLGGQVQGIAAAFRRASDWPISAMVTSQTYLRYPEDLPYSEPEIRRRYRAADVVHLHNTLYGWRWLDDASGKPIVLHHHGTGFRENHEALAADVRKMRAVQVVATLDLEILEPDVRWVPGLTDIGLLRSIRAAFYRPSERIRIAHAPTNRAIKSTEAILAAFERLAERYPIDLDLIEQTSWAECLARKARADILVDQVILGYGVNAIEAWAMGIPVIAGTQDRAVEAHMRQRFGQLPFFAATEATLGHAIEALVTSREARAEYSAAGTAHVERWHSDAYVVPLLADIYANAPQSIPGPTRAQFADYLRNIRRVPSVLR
jgi:hypothetical protein